MRRRILGLFFAAVLCFSLIPMAVHVAAEETYDVWVNGEQFTSEKLTITCGEGTATYDPSTQTLTLNSAQITNYIYDGSNNIAIKAGSALNVVINGNCSINSYDVFGIVVYGDLLLTGPGNLDIKTEVGYAAIAMDYHGDLTLNMDGNLYLKALEGIWYDGNVTISGNGKVTIEASYGIIAASTNNEKHNVTISGAGDVTIKSKNTGIEAINGDLVLSGSGKLEIISGKNCVMLDGTNKMYLNGTGPVVLQAGEGQDDTAVGNKHNTQGSLIAGTNIDKYVEKGASNLTEFTYSIPYDVWVNGEQFTSNKLTITCGNGTATYDPATQTLTLDSDVNITGTYTDGSVTSPTALIFSANDLIINAPNGLNLENIMACGIYVKTGNLTVNGDVNITVANANLLSVIETGSNGVTINGNVNIQFIGDAAEVGYSAIDANDNIVITGDVNIGNFIVGLEASGSILVNGSATIETLVCGMRGNTGIRVDKDLYVTSSAPVMYAHVIYSENGSVSIGGNATIQYIGSDDEKEYDAILADKDIMIAGDVDIDGFEYGLFAEHGDIKVDGNASINTSFYGMASGGTITMVSGKWDISSENVAMNSDKGIIIPETHIITTPEDGKVEKVTVETLTPGVTYSYYSVATTDNKPAEHVIIEVKPAPEYAVTFNMNDHGDQVAAQTVKEGEKAVKPADPTASGYTFDGWYTDAVCSAKFDFETAINADTTVYAKWTEIPATLYTVTFNMNGHGDQIVAQTVKEGEKAVKPADPTANGYTFEGWYTDAAFSAKYDFDSAIKADTTIYAKWTEIPVTPPAPATYTVTFNMNGHGDQIAAQTVKEGEKAVKPADPTANGYTFEGWYTDAAFSAKYDFDSTIKADTTIYAKWTVKTEATKDPTRPDTGDNNRMFLWITLLIVSSIAMVSTGMYGRKRKYNE